MFLFQDLRIILIECDAAQEEEKKVIDKTLFLKVQKEIQLLDDFPSHLQ